MGQSTEEQLTGDIAESREELSRDVDELVDKVSPSRVVERRKQAVRGRFHRMRDSVMGSTPDLTGTAGHAGAKVTGRVSDAGSAVTDRAEGNPLAAGLVAFGTGALIGSLLPASQKEAQVAQRVVEGAKDKGQPLIDGAKSVGQEMGGQLKEQAGEAAQEVRSTAQDSAQRMKDEGQSSVQTLKDDPRSPMS